MDCLKPPTCSDPGQHPAGGGEKGAGQSCPAWGHALGSSGHGAPLWGLGRLREDWPLAPHVGPGTGRSGRSKSGLLAVGRWQHRFLLARHLSGIPVEKCALALGLLDSWFGGLWVSEAQAGLWPPLPPPHGDEGSQLLLAALPSLLMPGGGWGTVAPQLGVLFGCSLQGTKEPPRPVPQGRLFT